jgi:hypothetical protein
MKCNNLRPISGRYLGFRSIFFKNYPVAETFRFKKKVLGFPHE